MPNQITILVEDPDAILNAGMYGAAAEVQLQTSATEGGVYADVSGTGSTPTTIVLTGVRSYSGYDPSGTSSSWYRTRFTTADGTTRVSDWSDPFQVAPEGSGLICALWDVKQELGEETITTNDELITEKIRQVTAVINGYTGRLFTRNPASGTTTFLFDVPYSTSVLRVPKGIAAATALEVASESQPESGGTYTTVTAGEWFLRPVVAERDFGWPATTIHISDVSSAYFTEGYNTVRLTGALGWASVPADIQAIGIRASVAAYLSKGSGAGGVAASGPNGSTWILRTISPADRETLDWYAVKVLG